MVDDNNRTDTHRRKAICQRGSSALVVDENCSLVLIKMVALGVSDHLQVGELDKRKVFLMAYSAFVNNVTLDAESSGDHLVGPGGRNSVRVRIILHYDGVSFAAVRFKDVRQFSRLSQRLSVAWLGADICEGSSFPGHEIISFHSAVFWRPKGQLLWLPRRILALSRRGHNRCN